MNFVGLFLSKLCISAAFSCTGLAPEYSKAFELKQQDDELQNNSFGSEIVQNLAELWIFQAKRSILPNINVKLDKGKIHNLL